MIVKIDKSFQKDVSKINDVKIKTAIVETINLIQESEILSSINNLKKLSGYKDLYRIRSGNYRIGLRFTSEQELIFIRFLHRKEVYQRWP
ncbi:type II toxin-antitoxin system RelE family toxin [Mucilaginibacter ginsenosidivorans]|uniref:Type II toxin-antitoxin system RelE/ParE family toxin n=1 Tax=Mucilaginibacter ginsenosidivorans TaxID=398053 RepID=A0A5B8USY4_9SPHI|nr:type II toxin-antitoxin system RelE/ParE family toxin [Mucilaginibacter ginsenosidivorans]